jgi:hypothetical protein
MNAWVNMNNFEKEKEFQSFSASTTAHIKEPGSSHISYPRWRPDVFIRTRKRTEKIDLQCQSNNKSKSFQNYGKLLSIFYNILSIDRGKMSRRTDDKAKKFVDSVFSDLRALSNETKRKFHPVKEVRRSCTIYRIY